MYDQIICHKNLYGGIWLKLDSVFEMRAPFNIYRLNIHCYAKVSDAIFCFKKRRKNDNQSKVKNFKKRKKEDK